MSFQLSPHVDKNKIFFVQHSELQDRLDPLFYIALKNIKNNIEKKAKYQYVSLIQTCSINRGRFGHRPRNDPRFYDGEYPFIQTGDIVEASDSKTQIKYTQTLNELGLKTSKLFHPPKLLFTIAANIGDTAILDYSSCFPDSIVALIPKKDDITLEYLNIYLRLIKSYVVELAPYSAQRNLNNQQLAQVPIVIPPKEVQEEIAAKMDGAYAAKKQKEEEAQRLLDSIDDYLLSELGINLPEPEENTIQNRIFYRNLSELSGGRFDAAAHHKKLSFFSNHFPMEKFKDCVSINPLTLFNRITENIQATFIPMENVSDIYGEADISQTRSIEASNGYTQFLENDLIWAKITPCMQNGKSAVVSNLVNGIGFGSTEFHVFRAKTDIDIRYIYALLRLKVLRRYAVLYFSGSAGHQRVSDEFFRKLSIPKPPLEKQLEIVDRITTTRTQAKQLRQAAAAELEQAKQEVEAMILGERGNKA